MEILLFFTFADSNVKIAVEMQISPNFEYDYLRVLNHCTGGVIYQILKYFYLHMQIQNEFAAHFSFCTAIYTCEIIVLLLLHSIYQGFGLKPQVVV